MKKRTVYKLVKKDGSETRVNSKKEALAKYDSSQYIGSNPYIGVIRQRQEKGEDGYYYNNKTTIIRDRSNFLTDKYRRRANKSSMDLEIE